MADQKSIGGPKPRYVLYVSDSEESRKAIDEMQAASLECLVVYTWARTTPAVETGFGSYEGIDAIRSYILPDLSRETIRARVQRQLADAAAFRSKHVGG